MMLARKGEIEREGNWSKITKNLFKDRGTVALSVSIRESRPLDLKKKHSRRRRKLSAQGTAHFKTFV